MQILLQQLLQRSIQSSPLQLIDPRDHLIGMRECLREFNELDYMANGGVEFTTSLSNTIDRCLLIIHHYPFRIYTHHHSKRKFDIGVEWIYLHFCDASIDCFRHGHVLSFIDLL